MKKRIFLAGVVSVLLALSLTLAGCETEEATGTLIVKNENADKVITKVEILREGGSVAQIKDGILLNNGESVSIDIAKGDYRLRITYTQGGSAYTTTMDTNSKVTIYSNSSKTINFQYPGAGWGTAALVPGGSTGVNLTITNNTGVQVHRLYVDPSSSSAFSTDKLGATEFFETGTSKIIAVPANGSYDVRIIDKDGKTYTKYNITVNGNTTITFIASDWDGANLTITNNTGYQVHRLYVDPSSSSAFSTDKLGATEFFETGTSKIIAVPEKGLYDVRIIDKDGDVYTKYNINVNNDMTITFILSDMDPK